MTPHWDPATRSDRSLALTVPHLARLGSLPPRAVSQLRLVIGAPGRFAVTAKIRKREAAPGRSRETREACWEQGGRRDELLREGAWWRLRSRRCLGRCRGWKRRWRSCARFSRCCRRCRSASSANKRQNWALARFSPCSVRTIGEKTPQLERERHPHVWRRGWVGWGEGFF